MQKRLKIFIVLSVIGVLLSSYLTYQHFATSGSSFCVIDEYVNCDIVNKSTYSELFGIPVAILGALAYALMAVIAYKLYRSSAPKKTAVHALKIITAGSLLFSLYLTYAELFILYAICALCVSSQILVLILFILSLTLSHEKK